MFAASYIPVHVTRVSKAEQIWANNLGKPLLKVCHPPWQFQHGSSSLYCHHLLSCRVGMQTDWQTSQLWHHSWSRPLGAAGEPAQPTSFFHLQVGWLSLPHRERWAHIQFLLILNIFLFQEVCLMAHTPGGRGVYCRHLPLYPTAVNQRGKRSRNRNHRSTFVGQ